MSISEQTNEYDVIRDEVDLLRKLAASYNAEWKEEAAMVFSHAADTIESLSAKLQVANMERSAAGGFRVVAGKCHIWGVQLSFN